MVPTWSFPLDCLIQDLPVVSSGLSLFFVCMYVLLWGQVFVRSTLVEWWGRVQRAAWCNPDWRPDWSRLRGRHRVNTWTDDSTVHLLGINQSQHFHMPLHLISIQTIHIIVSPLQLKMHPSTSFSNTAISQPFWILPKYEFLLGHRKINDVLQGFSDWPSSVHPWWCSNWMGWPFFTVILKRPWSLGVGTD